MRSGKNVYTALKKLGYSAEMRDPENIDFANEPIDIVFIALHGPGYEDGKLQKKLEALNIPYTGCGILASEIGMNKFHTKQICKENNIPTPDFQKLRSPLKALPNSFSYPVILKPIHEGSSIDVTIIDSEENLFCTTKALLQKYPEYLLETYIKGKELTVGIIETDNTHILPILELIPKNRFYDFEAKYTKGLTTFVLPANINKNNQQLTANYAHLLFKKANCYGHARIDFMLCPQKGPLVLEINTSPGLTSTSDLPAQALEYGWSFETLIETILQSAVLRHS